MTDKIRNYYNDVRTERNRDIMLNNMARISTISKTI